MSRMRRTDRASSLTPLMLQILLALSEEDRHGYAIMQRRSDGGRARPDRRGHAVPNDQQLVDAELILEVKPQHVVHRQRRTYRLTAAGRKRASVEAQRLDSVVRWAQSVALIDTGRA